MHYHYLYNINLNIISILAGIYYYFQYFVTINIVVVVAAAVDGVIITSARSNFVRFIRQSETADNTAQ